MKKIISTCIALTIVTISYSQTYLPLTGGTLTGNLGIGSGPLSGGGASNWLTLNGSDYSGGNIYAVNGVAKGYSYYYNATNGLVLQGASGVPITMQPNGANALRLNTDGTSTFFGSLTGTSATFSGNVGVGTTSPSAKLDISTASGDHLRFIGRASSDYSDMVFYATNNTTRLGYIDWSNTATRINAETAVPLIFLTNSSERLRVAANGYIGIGTANPSSPLQISSASIKTPTGFWHTSITDLNSQTAGVGGGITFTGYKNGQSAAEMFAGVDGFKENSIANDAAGAFRIFTQPSSGAGLQEWMRITSTGNIGIGTTTPTDKLAVNGNIRAKEVKIETTNWPDYVFAPAYNLPDLKSTEQFIKENKHLPEIPSAAEVAKEGVNLGEMNAKLLKKIEELTLYMIEQNKLIQLQNHRIENLEKQIKQ